MDTKAVVGRAVLIWATCCLLRLTTAEITEKSACAVSDLETLGTVECIAPGMHHVSGPKFNDLLQPWTTCYVTCPYVNITTYRLCDDQGRWNGPRLNCKAPKQRTLTEEVLLRKRRGWRVRIRIRIRVRRIVRSIGNFVCSLFCTIRRPRDRTPPTLVCPRAIQAIADPVQTNGFVYYSTPVASDVPDGALRSYIMAGLPSGHRFSEGKTTVKYGATDRAGNSGHCSFIVTIQVIRCPELEDIENGYHHCLPAIEPRLGVRCTHGCYHGYELHGDSLRICLRNRQWSAPKPSCHKLSCRDLLAPPRATMTCSDGYLFQSQCTYGCVSGYDIAPMYTRVRACAYTGLWIGPQPICIDVERPRFTQCPRSMFAYTSPGEEVAKMIWTLPTYTDNSGLAVKLEQKQGPDLGGNAEVGSHVVEYMIRDSSFNTAISPCTFIVTVRRLTCARVYPTPQMTVTCAEGYGLGADCSFECQRGSLLQGHTQGACIRKDATPVVYWSWGEQQPFCKMQPCSPLNPGVNSAIACDLWLYGKFCQLFCDYEHDLPRTVRDRVPDLYVCRNDGTWNDPTVPGCTKSLKPRKMKRKGRFRYFTGDCTDPEVITVIKDKFLTNLKNSGYASVCTASPGCSAENVEVVCNQARRRRREAPSPNEDQNELEILVDLTVTPPPSSDGREMYRKADEDLEQMGEFLENAANNGDLDIVGIPGLVLEKPTLEQERTELECPDGYSPSYKTIGCVGCEPGQYFSQTTESCTDCGKGSYQEESGGLTCDPCPAGSSTITSGARSVEDCIDKCAAGHFSPSEVIPCTPCALGSYSKGLGNEECTACPLGTTTQREATPYLKGCKAFDISFTEDETPSYAYLYKDLQTASGSYKVDFKLRVDPEVWESNTDGVNILTMWMTNRQLGPDGSFQEYTNQNTLVSFKLSDTGVLNANFFGCALDGVADLSDGVWHSFTLVWEEAGTSCQVYHLTSRDYSQAESGQLYSKLQTQSVQLLRSSQDFRLNVLMGSDKGSPFIGDITDFNMRAEQATTDVPGSVIRTCADKTFGDVFSWADFANIDLIYASYTLLSQCDVTDDCASSPCGAHTCTDGLATYTCICNMGFTGTHCEENIDDCVNNACINGSCVDEVNDYSCQCVEGYRGQFCEDPIVNGAWSDWGDWSACSATCEGGEQVRQRYCNNPPPDNDGLPCPGNSRETSTCNTQDCPVCAEISPPVHGMLECTEEDKARNCTLACEDGYDFSVLPLDYYYCGPSSNFQWTFISEDNPKGTLPDCSETGAADSLAIVKTIKYKDLYCEDNIETKKQKLDKAIFDNIANLACMRKAKCTIEQKTITGCAGSGQRQTRETKDTMGVSMVIVGTNTPNEDAYLETLSGLEAAAKTLDNQIAAGSFTVRVEGEDYVVEGHSVEPRVLCPPGSVPDTYYCVACSPGTYADDDECSKCDYGTYQNDTGQASCMPCPEYTTTPGRGSNSSEDCSEPCDDCHIPVPDSGSTNLKPNDKDGTKTEQAEGQEGTKERIETKGTEVKPWTVAVILAVVFLLAMVPVVGCLVSRCKNKKQRSHDERSGPRSNRGGSTGTGNTYSYPFKRNNTRGFDERCGPRSNRGGSTGTGSTHAFPFRPTNTRGTRLLPAWAYGNFQTASQKSLNRRDAVSADRESWRHEQDPIQLGLAKNA